MSSSAGASVTTSTARCDSLVMPSRGRTFRTKNRASVDRQICCSSCLMYGFSSSSAATASDDIYNNVDEEDNEDKNDQANTYNKEGEAHDSSSSTAPSDETNVSENNPSTNTEQTDGSAYAASADGSAHGASYHDNEPPSAAQSSTSNADVADRQRTTWGKSLLGKLKQRLEDMGLLEDMNNPTE